MPKILKIHVMTTDCSANVVTLRFEDEEDVGGALVRIGHKLKLHLSKEEMLSTYALVLANVPSAQYFSTSKSLVQSITVEQHKQLEEEDISINLVKRSYKVVIIGLNKENENIHVDFCKEKELEGLLIQMSKTCEEKIKDLFLVSATNPDKELNLQKTLLDQGLVHEDVILLKSKKKRKGVKRQSSKRNSLLKLRKNSSPILTRGSSFSSTGNMKTKNSLHLHLPPIIFYPMRWIENNALDTPCIFQLSGRSNDVEEFKKVFALGRFVPDLDSAPDSFVVCDILKEGLKTLTSCIDLQCWERFNPNMLDNPMAIIKLLTDLGTPNILLLKSMCRFLNRVASKSSTNRMDANALGKVFAPLLCPFDSNDEVPEASSLVSLLISNPDLIPKKQHPPLVRSITNSIDTELATCDKIKPFLLLAEELQWQQNQVSLCSPGQQPMEGTLFSSNYRLFYLLPLPNVEKPFYDIPHSTIQSIRMPKKEDPFLVIESKNFFRLDLRFSELHQCTAVYEYLERFTMRQSLNMIFAFSHAAFYEHNGTHHATLSKPAVEYLRQGVEIPRNWRLFSCKEATSYPRQILIPSHVKEDQIHQFPKEYTRFRFPTLVYHHKETNACILISSNNCKASQGSTSSSVSSSYAPSSKLGPPTDPEATKTECPLLRCIEELQPSGNIETISCLKPTDLCKTSFKKNRKMVTFTDVGEIYENFQTSIFSGDSVAVKRISKQWIQSLSEVILSSTSTVVTLLRGKSFIVADDDINNFGAISRIMIILDPYYRTFSGFQCLIEHVWIRFGFRFADASGIAHGVSKQQSIAPFVHFIDSVFQIFHQFPSCFEFTESYLITLLNSVFSGCFGTFLGNNEKQAFNMVPVTVSLWDFISRPNNKSSLLNPLYSCKDRSPLIPDTSTKKMVLWSGYFLQWPSIQGLMHYHTRATELGNDKVMDISKLRISHIPDSLLLSNGNQHTETLNISHNQISMFPTCLPFLLNLSHLNLSYNKIASIPQDVITMFQSMTLLHTLDLRGNTIVSIHESIQTLSSIRILRLTGCGDKTDLSGILKMTELVQLTLENFAIEDTISESISSLENLTALHLNGNKLASVTFDLPDLKILNLSQNNITDDGFDIRCRKLRNLDVSHNCLTSIPAKMLKLPRINKLRIHHNQLTILPAAIVRFTKISQLDISHNQITSITPNLYMMKKLTDIKYIGNPITFPPKHVVGKGTEILLDFLKDRMTRSVPLRRVRLLLVGQENVGKSSLSHFLKTDLPSEVNISTDGIQIDDWELKINTGNVVQPVDIKIWDFAGQEVYYSTHQLFLGFQAIYIVVWNIMSLSDDTKIRFWLESIKARTNGAPVLLVATHVDHEHCTPEYVAESLGSIEKKYCARFPFIKSIIAVSCASGDGFPQLRGIIKKTISELDYIGNFIPSKFLFLEEELVTMSKMRCPPMISLDEYKELAILFNCCTEEAMQALDYFHQWGSIVHHNDPVLKDMIILDPSWLVQVMATILTTKHRYIKEGILQHADLIHIWHDTTYPRHFHHALLELLQKFEVTYSLADKKSAEPWDSGFSLIPSVLPEMQSSAVSSLFPEFEGGEQYSREYKFNFIPAGFINHLIIRVIQQTKNANYWRYGIVGFFEEDPSSKVLLELLPIHAVLRVLVRGSGPVKYFLRVVSIIEAFIESWYHLDVSVQVPCTHCYRAQIKPIHRFSYETCKDAAVHGESYLSCPSRSTSVRLDVLVPDLSMAEVPRVAYSDITIENEIGKGGFATVYKAKYNGKVVALKQIDLGEGSNLEDAYSDFMRESWIMSGIKHPNIIGFLGLCSNPLCIVTDFAGLGNLFSFLHPEPEKAPATSPCLPLQCKIAYDIAKGMQFLHNRIPSIIHADLKSPNILLFSADATDPVVAVVADFGLSRTWVPILKGRQVDNPVWLAPEILAGKEYSESADVYAYGVILYEIYSGKEFFGEFTFMSALEDALMAGKRPELPDILPDILNLIELCWHQEPLKRPPFDDVVTLLHTIIRDHVVASEINLHSEEFGEEDQRTFESDSLVCCIPASTVITHAVCTNHGDDLWCAENGYISIWSIYDEYLAEKQIPVGPVHLLAYCDHTLDDSYGMVCSIYNNTAQVYCTKSLALLATKTLCGGEILAVIFITPHELWFGTSDGYILPCALGSSLSAHPIHITKAAGRITKASRSSLDKLMEAHPEIWNKNIKVSENVTLYNCVTGKQLLTCAKASFGDDNGLRIVEEMLSKFCIFPCLQTTEGKKNSKVELDLNVFYYIPTAAYHTIEHLKVDNICIGFKLKVEAFVGSSITCLLFDSDLFAIWIGTSSGAVYFDIHRGEIAFSISMPNSGPITSLCVVGSNIWLAGKDDPFIRVYNRFSLDFVREIDSKSPGIGVLVCLDDHVWSGSGDSILVWSASSFTLVEDLSGFHTAPVHVLLPTTNDGHFFSAAADGTAAVWKVSTNKAHWDL